MVTKEQMVFLLNRKIRELEKEEPSQVGMAQAGLSYEERQKAVKRHEEEQEENARQVDILKAIKAVVNEHASDAYVLERTES